MRAVGRSLMREIPCRTGATLTFASAMFVTGSPNGGSSQRSHAAAHFPAARRREFPPATT